MRVIVCDRDCDLALRGLRAVSGPLGILFDNFLKVLFFPFVCMCSADPLFVWIKLRRDDRRMTAIVDLIFSKYLYTFELRSRNNCVFLLLIKETRNY